MKRLTIRKCRIEKILIPFIFFFLILSLTGIYQVLYLQASNAFAFENKRMVSGEVVKDFIVKKQEKEVTGEAIEAVATSQRPILLEPLKLSDTYTQAYSLITLCCYHPRAESYTWEVYNAQAETWKKLTDGVDEQTDELGRRLSVLSVQTGAEDMTVRCTVFMTEGETVTDEAVIHIIPDIESIEAEDYTVDAGTWISGRDIPVCVSYMDGTQETVTGLHGLTFVDRQENREYSVDENGHAVETVTTVNTVYEYTCIEPGHREFLLRCCAGEQELETRLRVKGKDAAPVVSVALENPEGWCETNKLIVDAADYSPVEYRFINGEEDSGWTEWNEYAISRNGTWEIQVRDVAGNVTTETVTVSNIDNQKPVIQKISITEGDKNKDEKED